MVANAVLSLNALWKPTDRGLEWGSGRSTAWLAERVAHVVTVEHDPGWHTVVQIDLLREGVASKLDYRLIEAHGHQLDEPEQHPYAQVANEIKDKSLDFVVVDRQMRLRCIQLGLSKVINLSFYGIIGCMCRSGRTQRDQQSGIIQQL